MKIHYSNTLLFVNTSKKLNNIFRVKMKYKLGIKNISKEDSQNFGCCKLITFVLGQTTKI